MAGERRETALVRRPLTICLPWARFWLCRRGALADEIAAGKIDFGEEMPANRFWGRCAYIGAGLAEIPRSLPALKRGRPSAGKMAVRN